MLQECEKHADVFCFRLLEKSGIKRIGARIYQKERVLRVACERAQASKHLPTARLGAVHRNPIPSTATPCGIGNQTLCTKRGAIADLAECRTPLPLSKLIKFAMAAIGASFLAHREQMRQLEVGGMAEPATDPEPRSFQARLGVAAPPLLRGCDKTLPLDQSNILGILSSTPRQRRGGLGRGIVPAELIR